MKKDKLNLLITKLDISELTQIIYLSLREQIEKNFIKLNLYFKISLFLEYLEKNKRVINESEFSLEEILELKYNECSFNSLYIFCKTKGISEIIYLKEISDFLLESDSKKEYIIKFLLDCGFDENRCLKELEYLKKIKKEFYIIEIYKNYNPFKIEVEKKDLFVNKNYSLKNYRLLKEMLSFLEEEKIGIEKIFLEKIEEILNN